MQNKDLPAMPFTYRYQNNGVDTKQVYQGLSKREHFAGLAMNGILSNPDTCRVLAKISDDCLGKALAELSTQYAGDLLEYLENAHGNA